MTKRATILHGTSGNPNEHWLPWVKHQLEQAGYEVYAPLLPDNDRPNQKTYEQFLQKSGWDFSDNILVGHSSGATTALNLLLSEWFPHAKAVVLAGTFLNEKWTKDLGVFPAGNFDDLFIHDFDSAKLTAQADTFYFVHGDNDPYCDIEDAKQLCQQVQGTFIAMPGGHHLGGSSGITELPELIARLKQDGIL
ncbi:hypothetical protein EKI60_00735 [Candidatus Saccharibacteria bacterium]|nr:MAG: hypothetical protein EKI60_00735 [Candidatus Saccharibacteria bacterium]